MSESLEALEGLVSGLITRAYGESYSLFSNDELKGLYAYLRQLKTEDLLRPAKIGSGHEEQILKQVRNDQIYWLDQQSDQPFIRLFFDKMNKLSEYITKTCFLSLNHLEFHFAHYAPGHYYLRHLDSFRGGLSRKLSVILYLNPDWQKDDGGELKVYLEGREALINPCWGKLVIFKSDELEHEVLPTNIHRFSICGWLRYDEVGQIGAFPKAFF